MIKINFYYIFLLLKKMFKDLKKLSSNLTYDELPQKILLHLRIYSRITLLLMKKLLMIKTCQISK